MSDNSGFFDDDDLDEPTVTLPAVGGVRITGATPASDDPLADWNLDEKKTAAVEMPHWTDEPTGQVPAILDREEVSDDPLSGVSAPVWREDNSDWTDDSDAFESLILEPQEEPMGALNPEQVLEESQPWEFNLDDLPGTESSISEEMNAQDAPGQDGLFSNKETLDPWNLDDIPATPLPPMAATSPAPRRRGRERQDADEREPSRYRDQDDRSPRQSRDGLDQRDGGGRGKQGRDLPVAIITGVLIAVLVLVTFDIGTLLAMVLVIVVVTLAAAEVFAAFRRGGYHPATLLGLVATIALLIAAYNRGTQAIGLIAVLLFIFTVIWYMIGVEKTDALKGLASTMLVFAWIGIFGSYAALLLNPNLFPDRHGLAYLLGGILVSIAYDIAALFIGSSIGKRPLAPSISPNKTWEGLIGGSVAAILMAVIVVHLIHPWTLMRSLVLGIVVAIVSPLGDLTESLVKRNLGLKDMGRLLPGHGGMMDRVDGLLFVLPATFYVVQAFHLA